MRIDGRDYIVTPVRAGTCTPPKVRLELRAYGFPIGDAYATVDEALQFAQLVAMAAAAAAGIGCAPELGTVPGSVDVLRTMRAMVRLHLEDPGESGELARKLDAFIGPGELSNEGATAAVRRLRDEGLR